MNNKSKRKKLESYIELKYEIDRLHNQLVNIASKREDIESIKAIRYSDEPKGGSAVGFDDLICSLVDSERKLISSLTKAEIKKDEIEKAVKKIDNVELRMILKMRYLEDCTFAKIGSVMNYDKSTIWRKCNSAIDLIEL